MLSKKGGSKSPGRTGAPVESMLTASDRVRAVVVEIKRIRTLSKEIAANFVSKIEARVIELIRIVETSGADCADQIPPMLKRIRELSVKPNKGRRKDLRQLEELLEDLWAMAEGMEEKSEKQVPDKKNRVKKVLASAASR